MNERCEDCEIRARRFGPPARSRTSTFGFGNRILNSVRTGRVKTQTARAMSDACGAPPEIRTRKKSFRRRRLVHRACGAESREGVAPSRAVLQTAILTREPAHDSLQKHSNKSALGGNRTRTANVKCPFGKLASLPRPFETRPGASATLGLTPPRAALSRTSPASSHMEQVHSHLFARFRFRSFFRCPFRWDDQGGGVGENRIRISRVQTGRSPI
jgi:hypothetical protein